MPGLDRGSCARPPNLGGAAPRLPRPWIASAVILPLLLAGGCRQSPPGGRPDPRGGAGLADVLLEGVPHVLQRPDFCGEACVEMALRKLGARVSQDDVFEQAGVDPAEGRGAYTAELVRAATRLGFKVGPVWRRVPASRTAEGAEQEWRALHADLLRGVPSIVCGHYDDSPGTTEHFRLVLGYRASSDEVIYHEPAEADGAYRRMARSRFLDLWPLQGEKEATLIRLRLEPSAAARAARPVRPALAARFAQHVRKLREKLTGTVVTIVVQPPFVVIGDESPERVRDRAERTVKWAALRLKQDFFERDPEEIIDIWLFKDAKTYRSASRRLFKEEPDTPYGYYLASHHALVMNIATGGGTLVHEIVHPFMRANFPRCPAWLNEGMGSLFEQCGDEDGHITGYTNWRLAGLQEAIEGDGLPSFKELLATTDKQFYQQDKGTNYAQARYLCYYLQEHKLLRRYFRELRAAQAQDPTGYETLKRVLGRSDLQAFQKEWERWVLKLRFDG